MCLILRAIWDWRFACFVCLAGICRVWGRMWCWWFIRPLWGLIHICSIWGLLIPRRIFICLAFLDYLLLMSPLLPFRLKLFFKLLRNIRSINTRTHWFINFSNKPQANGKITTFGNNKANSTLCKNSFPNLTKKNPHNPMPNVHKSQTQSLISQISNFNSCYPRQQGSISSSWRKYKSFFIKFVLVSIWRVRINSINHIFQLF